MFRRHSIFVSLSVIRVIRDSLTNPTTTNQIYYLITTVMFIIGAGTAKLTRRIGTDWRSNRRYLKFRILSNHTHVCTPIREHKRSIHARMTAREKGKEMEREHACLLYERDLVCGCDNTIPPPHAASAQSQPTQEQISTRTFPFLFLLALALASPSLPELRFLSNVMCTPTHAQLVHRQAFHLSLHLSPLIEKTASKLVNYCL